MGIITRPGHDGIKKKYHIWFSLQNPPVLKRYKLLKPPVGDYVYYKKGKNVYIYGTTEDGKHLLFTKEELGFDFENPIMVREKISFKKIFKKFLASLIRYVGLAKREHRNTI